MLSGHYEVADSGYESVKENVTASKTTMAPYIAGVAVLVEGKWPWW